MHARGPGEHVGDRDRAVARQPSNHRVSRHGTGREAITDRPDHAAPDVDARGLGHFVTDRSDNHLAARRDRPQT